jgi:hypothetical protein
MKIKVWTVTSCTPEGATCRPAWPGVFGTEAEARAHFDQMMKYEWICNGPRGDDGRRLPYPDDADAAHAAIVRDRNESGDEPWGEYEISSHKIDTPETIAAALEAERFDGDEEEPEHCSCGWARDAWEEEEEDCEFRRWRCQACGLWNQKGPQTLEGDPSPGRIHTNDLGVAIRDALEGLGAKIDKFDWTGEDVGGPRSVIGRNSIENVDASYGFSDLRVGMRNAAIFRVKITREQ